jgi:hypothetical protein
MKVQKLIALLHEVPADAEVLLQIEVAVDGMPMAAYSVAVNSTARGTGGHVFIISGETVEVLGDNWEQISDKRVPL